MIGHVGEVPEAVADRPQEHLEQVLEAEQLLADLKPHWALPPLARIQEPQDHPLVLQQHPHPDLEETQRRGSARGARQRLAENPVARLDAEAAAVSVGHLLQPHLPEHGVDEILAAVAVPLLPHLVADHDVDRHLEGRVSSARSLQGVGGRVGSLPTLPPLALAGAEAERDHRRDPLRLEPREDRIVVEASVEEDGAELPARHLEVVKGQPNGGEGSAAPRVEPKRRDEAEAGEEDGEGSEPVGAVSAPFLLGLHHLASTGVLGLTVVRSVVEVDGDIDGLLRDVGADLSTEAEGDGPLRSTEAEVSEEPSGGAVGVSPTALGSGAMDGGAEHAGAEKEIGGVTDGGGTERSTEGALQERKQPDEGRGANLAVGEGPRPPAGPAERWVFVSVVGSLRCGRKTAAAACWRHTDSSAVFLSSTSVSIGRRVGRNPPRNHRITSGDRLPSTGLDPPGTTGSTRGDPRRRAPRRTYSAPARGSPFPLGQAHARRGGAIHRMDPG